MVLSPEEIAAAFPNVTQTIEIEAILDADEIPFVAMERPQEPRGLDRCRLPAQRTRHHHQRLDRPGMGVSVPVAWDELGKLTSGAHWIMQSDGRRLRTGNGQWQGYDKAAVSLTAAMKALGRAR